MKKKLLKTFQDLDEAWTKNHIDWLLTRYNMSNKYNVDDLDILVKGTDFQKSIKELHRLGYRSLSHDEALGGRIKGYQVNLVKDNRIKIDLHKDFTWRKSKYLDLDILWNSKTSDEQYGTKFYRPNELMDSFLVIINILFEKTYILKSESGILKQEEVFTDIELIQQSRKYGWNKSMKRLSGWIDSEDSINFPKFLPITLVLYSYLEKFLFDKRIDLISLFYYFFFRFRYTLKGKLPY